MELIRPKPYEGNQNYIFVSYSHRDSARVFPLIDTLTSSGFRVWYDEGIDPGTEWPESIAAHLANCDVCIAFISPNSVQSLNCRREINFALSRNKGFLSVLLEPTEMSPGMEMQISTYQSLLSYKYASKQDFEQKLISLDILKQCREQHTAVSQELEQKTAEPGVPAAPRQEQAPIVPEPPANETPESKNPVPEKQKEFAAKPHQKPAKPKKNKQTADRRQNAENSGKTGKKRVLLPILLSVGAAITALVLLLVINPFKKQFKIGDKTYSNEKTITISGQSIRSEATAKLSRFNQCNSLTFEDCTFEAGAVDALGDMNLSILKIKNCSGIDSMGFLSSLKELWLLEVNQCGVTDEMLDGLVLSDRLQHVALCGNELTRLPQFLSSAGKLSELDCSQNRITDISTLPQSDRLTVLKLAGNEISDIHAIAAQTKLTTVDFSDNRIDDTSAFIGLVHLKKLDLSGNRISSLSGLENCSILEAVFLAGNTGLKDASVLVRSADTLQKLDLSGIALADPSYLSALAGLTTLNVNGCGLADIGFVHDMTSLETLNAAGNRIETIEALGNLTNLTVLNLSDNRIGSAKGLPAFTSNDASDTRKITVLLHNNNLSDLDGIDCGAEYRTLTVFGNPISDSSAMASVKGYSLITEMIPGIAPETLTGFTRIFVPETDPSVQLEWENAVRTRLEIVSIEEAMQTTCTANGLVLYH